MQNQSYRSRFGISQSSIKDFRFMTPQQWYNKYILYAKEDEKQEDHLDYGSLVDTMMFTPELLSYRFHIAENMKLPSDSIKNIVDQVYSECVTEMDPVLKILEVEPSNDIKLDELKDEILAIAKSPDHNYGKGSYKDERILKDILEKGSAYFETKKQIGGKILIDLADHMMAMQQKEILQNHPRTRPFFIQQEGESLHFQLEIFMPEYEFENNKAALIEAKSDDPRTVYRKGAIDILRINHIEKWAQILDFKTSFDAHNFRNSIKKYGYGAQGSFYTPLVRYWLDAEGMNDYEILPFCNAVIDKNLTEPYIYRYRAQDLETERVGYNDHRGFKEGWATTMENILWHIDNGIWAPRELHEKDAIDVTLYQD